MKWAIIILIAIVLNIVISEVSASPYDLSFVGHIGYFLGTAIFPAGISALVSGGAVIPKANRHKFPRYFSLTFLGFSAVWAFIQISQIIFERTSGW